MKNRGDKIYLTESAWKEFRYWISGSTIGYCVNKPLEQDFIYCGGPEDYDCLCGPHWKNKYLFGVGEKIQMLGFNNTNAFNKKNNRFICSTFADRHYYSLATPMRNLGLAQIAIAVSLNDLLR